MNIIKEHKNSLLDRKEIVFELHSSGNPGLEMVRKTIVDKMGVSDEVVAVKKIDGQFGSGVFIVHANVYNSAEKRKAIEPKVKEKKK